MNKLFILVFFSFTLQAVAQQPEYFNFTDTAFQINAIKKTPYMWHLCGHGVDAYDQIMLDSIAAFLKQHPNIVLELGVHYATKRNDIGEADYFKSLLIDRGADATRIITKGYGNNYIVYTRKEIKQFYMYRYSPGAYVAENMSNLNNRIELKILQQ